LTLAGQSKDSTPVDRTALLPNFGDEGAPCFGSFGERIALNQPIDAAKGIL
jgi:hypothetical protein